MSFVLGLYRSLFLVLWDTLGFFGAIVGISVIVSIVCFPLYNIVGRYVAIENLYQSVINPKIVTIKGSGLSAADTQAAIERLYSRYNYNPVFAIRKVLPLFISVPFLMLTYYMLAGTPELEGVKWLCFGDLSKPDGMLFGLNLLPFVMTGVNLLTVYATPSFNKKDEIQAWVIALFFLVLLYSANTALMIYWTLNQIFNFIRSLYLDRWSGAKILWRNVRGLFTWRLKMKIPSTGRSLGCNAALLVRNFVIAFVCIGLPLIVAIFGFMPDRLDIELTTKTAVSVSVDGQQEGCLGSEIPQTVSFFFADRYDPNSSKIEVRGADLDYRLDSMHVARNLFVDMRLEAQPDGSYKEIFAGLTLPPLPYVWLCPYLFALGCLFLAFIGLYIRCEESKKVLWLKSVALAFAVAFFFVVFMPIQTIFNNRMDFDYPVAMIFRQISFWFAVYLIGLTLLLRLFSVGFGLWGHVGLFAFLAYEYLQTGILAMGYPKLDGSLLFYMDKMNGLKNALWMLAIFAVVFFFAKRVRKGLVAISFFAVAVMALSFLDTHHNMKSSAAATVVKSESPWTMSGSEVVEGIRLSPDKNVILLIPDSMQSDATWEVISKNEDLREIYSGFTAFNNNVGMFGFTRLGIPGLLTGKYCQDPAPGVSFQQNYMEFSKCVWSKDSAYYPYAELGYPYYLLPGIGGAYSNRIQPQQLADKEKKRVESIFMDRSGPMGLCLQDCLRFREVPFILKQWALRVSFLGVRVGDGSADDKTLFPSLTSNPLSDEHKPAFTILYTIGAHLPVHYDENGNRIYKDKDSYKAFCGQTHFILKCIGGFLQDLKRKGIYDKSLIVIVGDHGSQFSQSQWPGKSHMPSQSIPMLWVKPIGATGAFAPSDAPTSHSRVAELLKRSATEDFSIDQIIQILSQEKRYFRNALEHHTEFTDYTFDAEGNIVK